MLKLERVEKLEIIIRHGTSTQDHAKLSSRTSDLNLA